MNVILITLDALRKDRIGAYGSKKKLTPAIDSFANQGAIFESAITANTSSTPSHTSVFTSNYSVVHGVKENGWKLKKDMPTLAKVFLDNGFETMAAVSVENLSSFFGLNKGFKSYYNSSKNDIWYHRFSNVKFSVGRYRFFSVLTLLRKMKVIKNTHTRPSEETNRDVFKWLEKNSKKKFFCWIHYFDIHTPYKPDYDSSVKINDSTLGALKEKLKELKVLDDTVIVLFADHGEMLGEHGYQKHGYTVYDEEINVPLIFWNPKKVKKVRIKKQVRTIDIAPTILEIANLPIPKKFAGRSLLPYIDGKMFSGFDAFTEAYPPYRESRCIRTKDSWKYIFNGDKEDEFYDLREDPKESKNLLNEKGTNVEELIKKLKKWFEEGIDTEEQKTDDYTRQKLEALGYI